MEDTGRIGLHFAPLGAEDTSVPFQTNSYERWAAKRPVEGKSFPVAGFGKAELPLLGKVPRDEPRVYPVARA